MARGQDLTHRQQLILQYIIQEHVNTANPVASQTLADTFDLGVSPATIRNEMAVLEERGYLMHPHTSAGREPTVKGYRYFVEGVMQDASLPPVQQRTIRHQFYQARMGLDHWLRLAAAVLANTAHAAGWATAPQPAEPRLKHVELIHLGGLTILLIVVLEGGTVHQQLLTAPEPLDQDQLTRISNALNDFLTGQKAGDIAERTFDQLSSKQWAIDAIVTLMRRMDESSSNDLHHEGLAHILREPEFAEAQSAETAISILERRYVLDAILTDMAQPRDNVQVIIGGEEPWEEIQDCSLVLAFYGPNEEITGALGVLGPRRMAYESAVPAVRYVSGLMTDLLENLYGQSTDEISPS